MLTLSLIRHYVHNLSKNPHLFTEPEGLIIWSKDPATGHCHHVNSNLIVLKYFFEIHFNIGLTSICTTVSSNCLEFYIAT